MKFLKEFFKCIQGVRDIDLQGVVKGFLDNYGKSGICGILGNEEAKFGTIYEKFFPKSMEGFAPKLKEPC